MKVSLYILIAAGALIAVLMVMNLMQPSHKAGGTGGDLASACAITATTSVVIGNQVATTIAASYAARAWLMIQQPAGATNTVAISLNGAAVSGAAMYLSASSTASPVNSIVMGLNTQLPYTGAVSAITNSGSSTVIVTDCHY